MKKNIRFILLQLLIDWCHDFLDASGDRTADGITTDTGDARALYHGYEKKLKLEFRN